MFQNDGYSKNTTQILMNFRHFYGSTSQSVTRYNPLCWHFCNCESAGLLFSIRQRDGTGSSKEAMNSAIATVIIQPNDNYMYIYGVKGGSRIVLVQLTKFTF